MTAYLVLKRYPLNGARDGFTLTVSAGQAEGVAQDRAEGQSVVTVAADEQLTERQLLEALLIPSGNNVARMLGEVVTGSDSGFVEDMNREARALGMDHTTYTDPSGWDPGTVSTAADQLRVFEQAMRLPVFRQIVSMPSVTLPVAGTLTNFNPLVADGYAGKTGSDSAARGCLAFFTEATVAGRGLTAVGVVLGQGQAGNTQALLAAAGQAAQQLVGSVALARVSSTPASGGSLPSASTVSPDKRGLSTSSRSSAASPSGRLPSPARSSLPAAQRTAAGPTPTDSPARSLPRPAVGGPGPTSASPPALSSPGTLPSRADSSVGPPMGTPAGSTSADAPARSMPRQ